MTTVESRPSTAHGLGEEYPFEPRDFAAIDARMSYIDEGPRDGSTMLFVHGNPTWSFFYRNLVKRFSREHRCLAIDHIGCGLSDKPRDYPYTLERHVSNLASFIEAHDLKELTLVVHDWGGAIGLGAAARMPERFSRLVITNTAAFRSKAIPLRIAACRVPVFGRLAVQGLNAFARAATFMAVEKPLPPAVKRGYLAPYDSWSNRRATIEFVRDIPLEPGHPSYETLRGIEEALVAFQELPTLILWGMRDWCFTPAFLDEWRRRLPSAEVLTLDEAGHYLFEDAREVAENRIADFLARTGA